MKKVIVWRMFLRLETWRHIWREFKHRRTCPFPKMWELDRKRSLEICVECGHSRPMDEFYSWMMQERDKAHLTGTLEEFEDKFLGDT